ncbi:GapS4b family protein [Psychromonas sp. PT13]|uniref:GapS4b family protein n=1 Tax=Psychromonas sp. PT13 TaxID=3439547 RepID=UPI003EBEB8B2
MNKKYLLPYGDALREFLNDSGISKSDLRTIVRKRGIFVSLEEKISYIPILVRTGITPLELIELNENLKVREANPKRQTQSIKCESDSSSLMVAIPTDYKINDVVKKEFSNYKLLGNPAFKTVENDSNHIELDFSIERYDYTQSWNKNTSQFTGKVKFRKKDDTLDINISLSHTSEETKEVANKIASDFIKKLKDAGCVKNTEKVKKIHFKDFTNESRINFFQDLSQKQMAYELYFKDTKDIGFCPDTSMDFPDEISWMQEKVQNLVIQGKKLHSTFFIKKKELHKHIQMHKVEASYTFDFSDYNGTCSISFEFPDFVAKGALDAELLIRVSGVKFKENKTGITQSKMKEVLLSQLEESKLTLYKQYSTIDNINSLPK